jgi:hypothetical protein
MRFCYVLPIISIQKKKKIPAFSVPRGTDEQGERRKTLTIILLFQVFCFLAYGALIFFLKKKEKKRN